MKFSLDARPGVNLIRSYRYGEEIRVGEKTLHASCIVSGEALVESWAPASIVELDVSHLEPIFQLKPEVVLLGTGATQRFPSAAVRAAFASRGIGLESMDLGAACRTFNILVQEERRVVAALFLS